MKKNIIISGIVLLCIFLLGGIYYIISNSTVEIKTTRVDIDGNPIKEEIKNEKEVKKETKKDDNENTQYVIHTTGINEQTGEVGYGIFTLNGEKIKDLKEVYSLTTTDKGGYESVKNVIINDSENSFIFDNTFKFLGKIKLKDYGEKSVRQIFGNKIDNNIYFQTKTKDYNDYNLLQDSKGNLFDTNFSEFITFLGNGYLLVKTKDGVKQMILTNDLKPLLKSSFDNIYEYSHTYKGQKIQLYKIELNDQYYLYYDNNGVFENINGFNEGIGKNTDIYLIENKLYILNKDDIDKYYNYDLKIDEKNKIQIGNQEIIKIGFDINSINLDGNGIQYTSKTLQGLGEYNGKKIYKYWFSYTSKNCSILGCNNDTKRDVKFLNYNGEEIKQDLEKYLYDGYNYKSFFSVRDINLSIQKNNIDRYDPDNINVLNKSNNFGRGTNYINLYDKNNLTYIDFDKTYSLGGIDFNIIETPNGVYLKNKNTGEVSNTFSEIKNFYKNENIFSIKTTDNKSCLYKENNGKIEEYYCSKKEILGYKEGYILEGIGYNGDFGELVKENGIVKFKKMEFLDNLGKEIIVSEFNSTIGNVLLVDNQNNFYLFEYANTNGIDMSIFGLSKPIQKLIYSGKREGRDDFEIFIVNKNILNNSILKD